MLFGRKGEKNELPIPPDAQRDAHATEMARVWVAEGGIHCNLRIGGWQAALAQGGRPLDEPRAWGILLADLARHASRGLAQKHGTDVTSNLQSMADALLNELQRPTAAMEGALNNARRADTGTT